MSELIETNFYQNQKQQLEILRVRLDSTDLDDKQRKYLKRQIRSKEIMVERWENRELDIVQN